MHQADGSCVRYLCSIPERPSMTGKGERAPSSGPLHKDKWAESTWQQARLSTEFWRLENRWRSHTDLAEQRCWNQTPCWGRREWQQQASWFMLQNPQRHSDWRTRIFQMKFRAWSKAANRAWLIEYSYPQTHTPDTELGNSSGKGDWGSSGHWAEHGVVDGKLTTKEPVTQPPALPSAAVCASQAGYGK